MSDQGVHGVTVMLSSSGSPPELHTMIHQLFMIIWATVTTPHSTAIQEYSDTVQLYKKDYTTNIANYRPIGLANILYKLWTRLITCALYEYAELHNILSSSQAGFRQGR